MKEFQQLVGEQLSAVCFVQNYVQLQFNGYQLTTYTTLLVKTEKGAYLPYADEAYKNRLCSVITQRVEQVTEEQHQVAISFVTGIADLILPLHSGWDNIYYADFEERWFVI